jgi:hypothetical protein
MEETLTVKQNIIFLLKVFMIVIIFRKYSMMIITSVTKAIYIFGDTQTGHEDTRYFENPDIN